MQIKQHTLIAVLLLCGTAAMAQMELGTHFMQGTWQATRTNPALLPEHKIVVGLPGLYNNLHISNITFDDLTTTNAAGDKVIDATGVIGKLNTRNELLENLDIETVSVALRVGKLFFSLGHSVRFNALIDYPKTLPQLIWQGNAQFIGQEVAFGTDLALSSYHEFALGAGMQLTKYLTIGGRAKYLSGIADARTTRTDLRLFTDGDVYQLRLRADYAVQTSSVLEYNNFDDLSFNFNFGNVDTRNLFSQNSGFAIDLGAVLDIGKLKVAASVLDIGQIQWKESARTYSLQGEYEFAGLDIAQELLRDSSNFGSILDSLTQSYTVGEQAGEYSYALPMRLYLSGSYDLTEKLRLGALFYTSGQRGKQYSAAALGANYQVLPWWNMGGLLAYRYQAASVGLNTALKLGPVQIVAATDNIVAAFRPNNSNSANVRVGLNLVFGGQEVE